MNSMSLGYSRSCHECPCVMYFVTFVNSQALKLLVYCCHVFCVRRSVVYILQHGNKCFGFKL